MQNKTQHEAAEQAKLFKWAFYMRMKYPSLSLLFHIPNGGSRNVKEAAHLKLQGVKSGVPDLFLPAPRGKNHGLFIEMKYGKNKPTENQKSWIDNLRHAGYYVAVCYSWQSAADTIEKYLNEKI